MIYLKNTIDIQDIYIPRLSIVTPIAPKPTYEQGKEEGYKLGYGDGIEDQKDQLLNLYVTENGTYEREDGYGKVTVVVNEGGTDCKEAIETAYEDGYKEGYEDGAASTQIDLENKTIDIVSNGEYTVTPTDGFDALESVKISVDVPNEGKCNLEDKIITPQTNEVDGIGYLYVYPNEGYDGMKEVALYTGYLKDGWYNEGYEQGKAEGGECNIQEDKMFFPQLSEVKDDWLYVFPDEGYIGVGRTAIHTASLREGWYNEGYEQGKEEGGECNVQADKLLEPQLSEIEEGYLYVYPDEGYIGMSRTVIQTTNLREGWYKEGYEQGKEEGGNCNLSHQLEVIETNGRHYFRPQDNGWDGYDFFEVEVNVPTTVKLQDVWVTPSMADRDGNNLLVYSPNTDEGYDGLSRVVIDPQTIYNEGIEKGKLECVCPSVQEQITDYIYNQITLYSFREISFDDFEECFYDSNNEPITDVLVVANRADFEYSYKLFTKVPIKICGKIPYPNNALYGLTRLYFKNIPSVYLNYKDNDVNSLYMEYIDYLNMNGATLNGLLRIWLKGSTTFSDGFEIGTAQIKNGGTIYSDGTNTNEISSSLNTWTIINDYNLP